MDNNSDFIFIEDCKNDVSRLMNEIELKCDKLEILYRDYLREAVKQKRLSNVSRHNVLSNIINKTRS